MFSSSSTDLFLRGSCWSPPETRNMMTCTSFHRSEIPLRLLLLLLDLNPTHPGQLTLQETRVFITSARLWSKRKTRAKVLNSRNVVYCCFLFCYNAAVSSFPWIRDVKNYVNHRLACGKLPFNFPLTQIYQKLLSICVSADAIVV